MINTGLGNVFSRSKIKKKTKKQKNKKNKKTKTRKKNVGDETAFYHTELRHIIPDKFGN